MQPWDANTLLLTVQAEELDARILSAIIAGVRRAFPFVATEDVQPLIEKHSHSLFKMIHTAPFSVAVQALLLLFQLMSAQNAINDRFYRYSSCPVPLEPVGKLANTCCLASQATKLTLQLVSCWLRPGVKIPPRCYATLESA